MDRLTAMRIGVAFVGVAMWLYGYTMDNGGIRGAAIIVLAISLALRFLKRPPAGGGDATG